MYKVELVNIMYNVLDRKGRPEERKQLKERKSLWVKVVWLSKIDKLRPIKNTAIYQPVLPFEPILPLTRVLIVS